MDTEDEPSIAVLESEYSAGVDRITQQEATIEKFSDESMRMIRLLFLFIAAPTAVLGALDPSLLDGLADFIISDEPVVEIFGQGLFDASQIFTSTTICLLLGIVFHLMTSGYDARGMRNQTSPVDLDIISEYSFTEESYYRFKLTLLSNRIEDNEGVIDAQESLLTLGKIATTFGIIGVGTLFYSFVYSSGVSAFWYLAVAIVLFVVSDKLPNRFMQADRLLSGTPVYEDEYNIMIAQNTNSTSEDSDLESDSS